jgi:hypothetical protein
VTLCEVGHETHDAALTYVSLGGGEQHGLLDQQQIPVRFHSTFVMNTYDWERYEHVGSYCPADDRVSETIRDRGIWEPASTILALSACTPLKGLPMYDFGCQLGWYSFIAASLHMKVVAFDCESEMLRLMLEAATVNGFSIEPHEDWLHDIDQLVLPERIGFVKADVEGEEHHVVRLLRPRLQEQAVDHLLLEISPCFNDTYPDLVAEVISYGYMAFPVPHSRWQSWDLPNGAYGPALHMFSSQRLRKMVASWNQENVWFYKPDAVWA